MCQNLNIGLESLVSFILIESFLKMENFIGERTDKRQLKKYQYNRD